MWEQKQKRTLRFRDLTIELAYIFVQCLLYCKNALSHLIFGTISFKHVSHLSHSLYQLTEVRGPDLITFLLPSSFIYEDLPTSEDLIKVADRLPSINCFRNLLVILYAFTQDQINITFTGKLTIVISLRLN